MRQLLITGGLLGTALIASFVTWTGESSDRGSEQGVALYRSAVEDLEKLGWVSDELNVEITQRRDDGDPYLWVTLTQTITEDVPVEEVEAPSIEEGESPLGPEAAPESPTDEAPTEELPIEEAPAVQTITREETLAFLGSSAAQTLWESFGPLTAVREFPTADVHSTVFGLGDPTATVHITRRGKALELAVGAEAYGSKNVYVGLDQRVFLVDDKALRPFRFAETRLMERELQPNEDGAIEEIKLTKGEQTTSFVQVNRDDRRAAFWARASVPSEKDEVVGAWIDKLTRMRVAAYVDDASRESALRPLFVYEVSGDEGQWAITVLEDPEAAPDADDRYFAKSAYNRSLVQLTTSLASEAISDLATVLEE